MANVEHVNITDPYIHEPKGVASATSGQVYVANGSSSGAWTSQNPAYAQGEVDANATATTFTVVSTPVVIALGGGFVEETGYANSFTVGSNGRFTYTGTKDIVAYTHFSFWATVAGGVAKEYEFHIRISGVEVASSHTHGKFNGTDPGAVHVASLVQLSTNDYVEVYVENATDTTAITLDHCSGKIFQLGF